MNLHPLADALSDAIGEHGTRVIGRITGEAHTTILRRGEDLAAWPVASLLKLADVDDQIRSALSAVLSDESTSAGSLENDARETVRDAGAAIVSLMTALKDQRITDRERRRLMPDVRRLTDDLRRLMAGLEGGR